MEYNLGNLRIFPYKDIQELDKFYCGIAEMDKFIHNSNGFIMSIDNHYCKAFVVKDESNDIVAMFALNFDAISFKCLFSILDISRDTKTTTRMFRMLYPKQDTENTEETEEGLSQ